MDQPHIDRIGQPPIDQLWKPRPHELAIFESCRCSYEFSVNGDGRYHRHGKVEKGECQVYEYADDELWGYTRRVVFRSLTDAAHCQSFCNSAFQISSPVSKKRRNQNDRAYQDY